MSDLDRCYQILGVAPDASLAQLQQSYKQLLRVWSPDRFVHDPELYSRAEKHCSEIDEAYSALVEYLTANRRRQSEDPPSLAAGAITHQDESSNLTREPISPDHSAVSARNWWRVADQLVTASGSRIEGSCVVCNRRPAADTVREKLAYVPPALYLLLFLGIIGWILIFALIRRGHVFVALCDEHLRRRRFRRSAAAGSWVIFGISLVSAFATDNFTPALLTVAFTTLIAAIIFSYLSASVRTAQIRDGYVWLTNVSRELLSTGESPWPEAAVVHGTDASPTPEHRVRLSSRARATIAAIYVIGSGIAAAVLLSQPEPIGQSGFALVGGVVVAVVGGLIVNGNYVAARQRLTGFIVVAGIYSVVVAATAFTLTTEAKKRQNLRAAADDAARLAREILENGSDADVVPPTGSVVEAGLVPAARTHAEDMTLVLRWTAAEEKQWNDVVARLAKEAEAIEIEDVLAPHQLTSVAGLAAGRVTLTRFRQHIARYERVMRAETDRQLATARALNLSSDFRRGFLESLSETAHANLEMALRLKRIQGHLADEAERVISFMESRIGAVDVRGDTLYFENDEDVEWYNASISRQEKFAADEERLLQQMAQKDANRRATLEHLARELKQ